MSCGCQTRRKKDLSYVRSLAIKQSLLNEEDIQIYQHISQPYGLIYDYEPINLNRSQVVGYVRFKK